MQERDHASAQLKELKARGGVCCASESRRNFGTAPRIKEQARGTAEEKHIGVQKLHAWAYDFQKKRFWFDLSLVFEGSIRFVESWHM